MPESHFLTNKWARIKTSQWHILHSERVDADGHRMILTIDGEYLPYQRQPWRYDLHGIRDTEIVDTKPKIWEGLGYPKGRCCDRCSSFLYIMERTAELKDD